MRYPAPEKPEIIRIVEQSHLPVKRTLDQLGIARRTFCRWYDRYLEGGPEALEDRPSAPSRVWNHIPADIHDQIIELALDQSEPSPRELAARFTDEQRYFVSEATVYRLLKAHDLITSPAYVVIKAADRFHTQTTRPNEMWQTELASPPFGSPTSRSSGGAGCTCRPCSTTSRATSSPGAEGERSSTCAARCGPRMLPIRWILRWLPRAVRRPTCITDRACCRTMDPATSPASWPNTSKPNG
jgi:Homeodomain-like domain